MDTLLLDRLRGRRQTKWPKIQKRMNKLTSVIGAGHGAAAHLQDRDGMLVLADRSLAWVQD